MIGFKKSLATYDFVKSDVKESKIDSDELGFGLWGRSPSNQDENSYAEKVAIQGLTFEEMDWMYKGNVWLRAAIDKIVDRASEVQPLIKPLGLKSDDYEDGKIPDEVKRNMDMVGEILIKPNDNFETLTTVRKKFSRDIMKYDAGAIEIVSNQNVIKNERPSIGLYNIAGNQVKIITSSDGLISGYKQVTRSLQVVAKWNKGEIIYGMLNPQSDKIYGLSPAESLVQTVTAELYTSNYQLDFYFNNATPRFAVMMEGLGIGQGAAALVRFRKWWDEELRGNPHRPIILGTENGQIKFEKVGMNNEEMQFQQYSVWLLNKICAVYKIPLSLMGIIGAGGSSASAENFKELNNQFNLEAIKPHLTLLAEKFNQQIIFSDYALGLNNVYLDFDLSIGDKKIEADIHDKYAKMGVLTINEIRTRGLGLPPVSWGNVPYLQNNVAPFGQGKNGQVLPGDAEAANREMEDASYIDDISNVPNTAISSKKYIERYLSRNNDMIGWEQLEVSDRLNLVSKLLQEKESYLTKVFINVPNKN